MEPRAGIAGTLSALAFSQAIASATASGGFMMGSLLLVALAGGDARWAGVPSALAMLSSAPILYPLARWKDVRGYRAVLALAFASGTIGTACAAAGAWLHSPFWVMAGFVGLGAASGSIQLSRYAAGELAPPERRAKSISLVITGATAGALGGPLLAHASEAFGTRWSAPMALAPFLALLALYGLGACIILPASSRLTRPAAPRGAEPHPEPDAGPVSPARLAFTIGSMVFGQVAMIFLMAVTPVHMSRHHHDTGAISLVLTVHFLGMYGMSFFTGWLSDAVGRIHAIRIGSGLLIISYLAGKVSSGLPCMLAALFLLGLGWNCVFVSGSALLTDMLKGNRRGRIQGIADGSVSFSSAAAGLASGLLLGALGYDRIAWIGLALGAVPLAWSVRPGHGRPTET